MSVLTRYIARQVAISAALALSLIGSFVFALQAMRLGHHLVGSGLGVRGLLLCVLYALPTMTVFALPFATVGAIVLVYARLHAGGEIEAMAACGATPRYLARGPVLVVALSAVAAFFASAHLEGPALERLQRLLSSAVSRAAISRIPGGVFHRLDSKTTLRVRRAETAPGGGASLSRVFVVQDPDRLLLAASGSIQLKGQGHVLLELRDGEAHQSMGDQGVLRARFRRLLIPLALGERFERHFGFVADAATRTTPIAVAATCLALGLSALAIVGWLARPSLCLAGAAALVGVHQSMLWCGQTLFGGHGPAIWLNCVLALGAAMLIVARGR